MRLISAVSALILMLAPGVAQATALCDVLGQIVAASDARFNEIVTEDGRTGRLIPPGFDRCTKTPERFGRLEYRCRGSAPDANAGRAAFVQANRELAQCPDTVTVRVFDQPETFYRRGERNISVWLQGGGADGLSLTVFAGNLQPGE